MSYTKGPWKFDPEDWEIYSENNGPLARVLQTWDFPCVDEELEADMQAECTANARLIAAAPELLEACKEFLESFEPYEEDSDKDTRRLLATMRAVVAKAEGRQP